LPNPGPDTLNPTKIQKTTLTDSTQYGINKIGHHVKTHQRVFARIEEQVTSEAQMRKVTSALRKELS
jgi:hypothetical protein